MIDELEALRAWAPPEADPDAEPASRARARVHAHMAAADARPRHTRHTRRRWWALGAAAVAAAGVALVLALGSGVEDGHVAPPPATAAQALERAARAAERQPAAQAFPRPDQFWYVRSQGSNLSCVVGGRQQVCALVTDRREIWLSESRRGRLRTAPLGHRWPTAGERRRWVALGRPPIFGGRSATTMLGPRRAVYLGNERFTYERLRAFRPPPAALFRRLRDGVTPGQGPSLYGEVYTLIGDALREQPAPPALRASLYRALKLVPGVRFGGVVRDRLGRRAVVVWRTEHGARRELLFDPDSSTMLGERVVTVRRGASGLPDAPAGTVLQDVVYERHAVVDRPGQRPR